MQLRVVLIDLRNGSSSSLLLLLAARLRLLLLLLLLLLAVVVRLHGRGEHRNRRLNIQQCLDHLDLRTQVLGG